MGWLVHRWPRREPALDERIVGISFVDVLFALVMEQVLEPLRDFSKIPGVGRTHLLVAALLTLTSWVGYHNSRNRPGHFIRFPNLPLGQFVLDILMVLTYWLTAVNAETAGQRPDAVPEAVFVATAFLLYVLWDLVGYLIRKRGKYPRRRQEDDSKARRRVTYAYATLTIIVAGVAWEMNTHIARRVYVFDGVLVFLIVSFRFAKEYFDTSRGFAATGPTAEAKLELLEQVVGELRRAMREETQP